MNKSEAHTLARSIMHNLPRGERQRLKSIDILPRLHRGMLTIRCYFINQAAEEPESYIFNAEEL